MAFDRWISQESERFETALPRTESEPANLIANSVLDNIGGGWGWGVRYRIRAIPS